MVKRATVGEYATIEFQVLNEDMPEPLLYWSELAPDPIGGGNDIPPEYIALKFTPPLHQCKSVRVYINPSPGNATELTKKPKDINPINIATESDELALWNYIDDQKCAVMVIVGRIEDVDFEGVSISVPNAIIRRYSDSFPKDVPADSRYWFGLTVAPLADVGIAIGIMEGQLIWPVTCPWPDTITVTFEFPDGTRRETVLTKGEGEILLQHVSTLSLIYCPRSAYVDFWTRAALVKLKMEFHIQDNVLKSIDGVSAHWTHNVDGYCGPGMWAPSCPQDHLPTELLGDTFEISWRSVAADSDCTSVVADSESTLSLKKEIGIYCPNADLGHADAQKHIGDLYYLGTYEVEKDIIRAYVWYSLAAQNGEAAAKETVELITANLNPE